MNEIRELRRVSWSWAGSCRTGESFLALVGCRCGGPPAARRPCPSQNAPARDSALASSLKI